MAISEHYHKALEVIDGVLGSIFKYTYERSHDELQAVKRLFPHEGLVCLDETPKTPFKEGLEMFIDSGWTDESCKPPSPSKRPPYERRDSDWRARDEEILQTTTYMTSTRPIYLVPNSDDPKVTNSFDMFYAVKRL